MQFSYRSWFAGQYPRRATQWHLRTQILDCGDLPRLMGIVNVTPDSFSDGGRYLDQQRAIEHALRLEDEGAELLDIGGESTRPYSTGVTVEEELRRVERVVSEVCRRTAVPVSIDTSKAAVAAMAIEAGAEIVNDVTALTGDPEMLPLVARTGVAVCLMHMRGTPQTMQDAPRYDDLLGEISQYLADRRAACIAGGIAAERICIDPGIGFGKTHQHNLTLMAHCHTFHALGSPVLVGHSRKGFIAKLLGDPNINRDPGVIGGALSLARQGIQIIRVHDVGPLRQAMRLFAACGGIDGRELQLD